MRIGQQVLSKIENLLTRCDASDYKKHRKYQKHTNENRDGNTFVKLYLDFKMKQQKQQERREERYRQQVNTTSPFKITNPHTIFLNAQKQQAPIHQRLQQIQNQKIEQMMRLKQKYPSRSQKSRMQQEAAEGSIQKEIKERKKRQKKFTEKEALEKVQDLQQKQRLRKEKLNMLRVKVIEQHSRDFRCKPYVRKETQQLWNRLKNKQQLSHSVFKRFEQYQVRRQSHFQQTEKRVREEVTPFAPKISEHSRLLASRSSSKTFLRHGLSRSLSCKCMRRDKSGKLGNSTAIHSSRRL